MEKPVKEWLNELPEPQKTEATENIIEQRGESHLDTPADSSTMMFLSAFLWDKSPQGHDYWSDFLWGSGSSVEGAGNGE